MHTLHTTSAFVVSSYPHGESNRVYQLLTHTLGFLYAHGQGVRELKNRNRYGLSTGTQTTVTLVRGRDIWRITGATAHPVAPQTSRMRRILALTTALVPREDASHDIYELLAEAERAFRDEEMPGDLSELLTALRLLRILGYVDQTSLPTVLNEALNHTAIDAATLGHVETHRQALIRRVNNALQAAI